MPIIYNQITLYLFIETSLVNSISNLIVSFRIFASGMKKLKTIASIMAVLIALLMSFDDSFAFCFNVNTIEMPSETDCSDVTHHHHSSLTDHYFQKNAIARPGYESVSSLNLFSKSQSITDHYLSSIWQPPQISC